MEQTHTGKWLSGISYEVAFWNNVYRWKHTYEGMLAWSHHGARIQLEEFDANDYLCKCEAPIVLDVGCGMSYATGNFYGTGEELKPLDIHYVDPLAYYFNLILKRHHRDLPAIEFGMVEYLSAFYPQHSIDLIIIQNAIDHSARPLKGIIEAIDVLKPGGILYLNHHPNEAETEHYKGFHQYNITTENGQLIIWNRNTRTNVSRMVGSFAQTEVQTHKNGHIVAIIRKTNSVPAHLHDNQREQKELCTALIEMHRHNTLLRNVLSEKLNYWRYNTIQCCAQALPWKLKMRLKKLIKQA